MDGTVIETQAPGAESSERQFVDPNTATPEQLREAMNNPDKFTFDQPETPPIESGATPPENDESAGKGSDEKPPVVVKDPDEDDHSAPTKNRVKVRIAHLSEAERDVMLRISKGARLADAQAAVVEDLVRGGKSLTEAETEVYGKPGRKAPVPTEKPAEKAPPEEKADPVDVLEKEKEALLVKLAEARAAYKVDEIENLRDQLEEKRWEIREAKEAAKKSAEDKQRETTTSFERSVQAATAEATSLFPDAAVEGTELFEEIADAVEDLRETNPAFFDNPRWPVILAAEKAAILGIPSTKVKGGANPQPGEKQPSVQPKKATRPVVPASGTSGGGTQTKPAEPADMEAELAAAGNDPEKLLAIVRKYGVKGSPTMSIADAFAVQP